MSVSHHGSIQLSMSFIITIIMSIALLIAGLALIKQFYTVSQETQKDLDERTQQRLEQLLGEGQQVVIPFGQQTVDRGASYVFGLGILNIEDDADFVVEVTVSSVFDETNRELTAQEIEQLVPLPDDWFLFDGTAQHIPKNEQRVVSLLVDVPLTAPSGLYSFNVKVLKGGQQYDKIQKIRVTVT